MNKIDAGALRQLEEEIDKMFDKRSADRSEDNEQFLRHMKEAKEKNKNKNKGK